MSLSPPSSSRPAARALAWLGVLLLALLCFPAASSAASEESKAAALDAAERLAAATGGGAQVSLHRATGVARFVRLPQGALKALADEATAADKAAAFFAEYGDLFGVKDAARDLVLERVTSTPGMTHVTYRQEHRGVPVFGGELRAHVDAAGELVVVNGTFLPELTLSTRPSWSAEAAARIAVRTVRDQQPATGVAPDLEAIGNTLYVYRDGLLRGVAGPDRLVYEVTVADPPVSIREHVYVDAHTGKVVNQITGIHEALFRLVYDPTLVPANLRWTEGDPFPTGNVDWDNEILGAGETYNLFGSMTGGSYLSYDGAMATMITVNNDPSINCPNANWNGISTNYCTGVTGDDTVSHEWGHAYTQFTNDLIYQWQSGALNESYSDIWGEVADLINGRGSDSPGGLRTDGSCSTFGAGAPSVDNTYRWLAGEDDPAFGGAIRDMWRPNCYGDPGAVSDAQYFCGTADGGGVHSNSGVPNRAFALIVDGSPGLGITGIGLTKAARLHWEAQNLLTISSNFADHADALDAACASLIGATLYELSSTSPSGVVSAQVMTAGDCAQVSAAIAATELRDEPTACGFEPLLEQDPPPLCDGEGSAVTVVAQDWESGLGAWTVGTRSVANPATFDTPDWAVVGSLPDGRAGSAAFVNDLLNAGDCATDLEAGVLYLQSPVVSVPAGPDAPRISFDHWVATEAGWDGGNLKVSVNGGAYQLVPSSAYSFNAYNSSLQTAGAGSDNPMAGEAAFTGSDGGSVDGTWGQSQLTLNGIAAAGDDVQLRFEMGLDGCAGLIGWYVDEVRVFTCSAPAGNCGNGVLDAGETCDDGNDDAGDGCSDVCQVEDHYECTDPTPPTTGTNVVADGSFEAGTPNPSWAEFSSNFGTPVCSQASCGGPAPADGTYHVWFGGIAAPETGSMQQTVTIPATASTLEFDLTVGICDSTSDFMRVRIDGTQVYTTSPCTAGSPTTVSVALGAFANGAPHTLRFESQIFALNGGGSNFFLDDVVIDDNLGSPGTPSVCTPIPEIAVNPPAITASQPPNALTYKTLNIQNVGAGDLTWSLEEEPGGLLVTPLEKAAYTVPPAQLTIGDGVHSLMAHPNPLGMSRRAPEVDKRVVTQDAGMATLTHSASQTVTLGNSVHCGADGFHADNSYLRVFDLQAFGITSTFSVTEVQVGVESASATSGSQPVTVNLYTLDGPFVFANLTQIGTATASVADQTLSILTVPVTGDAPPGSTLVVEVLTPDGGTANGFFVGSNGLGQTDASYLAAAACGLPEPTATSAIGFPNMHVVMNVTGDVGDDFLPCTNPSNVPWLSVSPTSGVTPVGPGTNVSVGFKSTGLATGIYEAKICVESDDPDNPLVPVPVTLTVSCDKLSGPASGKWNLPPFNGSIDGVSGTLQTTSGKEVFYFSAKLISNPFGTTNGGRLIGNLWDGHFHPAYEVRGSYRILNPKIAKGDFGAYIYRLDSNTPIGKISGNWSDRPSVHSIGRFRASWRLCD